MIDNTPIIIKELEDLHAYYKKMLPGSHWIGCIQGVKKAIAIVQKYVKQSNTTKENMNGQYYYK